MNRKMTRRHAPVGRLLVGVVAVVMAAFGASLTAASASVQQAETTDTTTAADLSIKNLAPKPLKDPVHLKMTVPITGQESLEIPMLAQELGEFKKENITIEQSVLPVPDSVVLLQQSQLDLLPAGLYAGLLNAIAGGSRIISIGPLNNLGPANNGGLYVRKDLAKSDGTVDPCSLKGKTVSFGGTAGIGATSSSWINAYFKTCKSTPFTFKDVQVSTLGAATLATALQSGSVDAGFITDPLASQVKAAGYAVPATLQPTKGFGANFISPKVADDTKLATAIARVLLRTYRTYLQGDYHKNPTVVAALAKVTGLSESSIASSASLVWDPKFVHDPEPLATVQKTWFDAGGLLTYPKPLPVSKIATDKYVKLALAGK